MRRLPIYLSILMALGCARTERRAQATLTAPLMLGVEGVHGALERAAWTNDSALVLEAARSATAATQQREALEACEALLADVRVRRAALVEAARLAHALGERERAMRHALALTADEPSAAHGWARIAMLERDAMRWREAWAAAKRAPHQYEPGPGEPAGLLAWMAGDHAAAHLLQTSAMQHGSHHAITAMLEDREEEVSGWVARQQQLAMLRVGMSETPTGALIDLIHWQGVGLFLEWQGTTLRELLASVPAALRAEAKAWLIREIARQYSSQELHDVLWFHTQQKIKVMSKREAKASRARAKQAQRRYEEALAKAEQMRGTPMEAYYKQVAAAMRPTKLPFSIEDHGTWSDRAMDKNLRSQSRELAKNIMGEAGAAHFAREDALLKAAPQLDDYYRLVPSPRELCVTLSREERALLIFVKTAQLEATPGVAPGWRISARYEALALSGPGCKPQRVALGDAEAVEALIGAWRAQLERVEGCYQKRGGLAPCASEAAALDQRGAALRAKVWAPAAAMLPDDAALWVVAGGQLAEVALDALPDDAGVYLVEQQDVRMLANPAALTYPLRRARPGLGALVVGDLDYERRSDTEDGWVSCGAAGCVQARRGSEAVAASRSAAVCGWEASWGSLGTTEAGMIAELLGKHLKGEVLWASGAGAEEQRLMSLMGGARMLHFATHGFFSPPQRCNAADDSDPLTHSGLVLSGANIKGGEGAQRGVLSAREVASLDLRGVMLVALSACETGRGVILEAEGALGLGRAFLMAGAREVIVSLWRVPSAPTRLIFERLYATYLRADISSADALRASKLAMVKEARDANMPRSAFIWGAFINMSAQ